MCTNSRIVKQLHPSWHYLFFNHIAAKAWVQEEMPQWSNLFESYPTDRQREQIFRWLILWKFGGFWVSSHVRLFKPLDPLLNSDLVILPWAIVSQSDFSKATLLPFELLGEKVDHLLLSDMVLGARAHHPFVEIILKAIVERAGFLNSVEPSTEVEELTTGCGVINAAWQIYNRSAGSFATPPTLLGTPLRLQNFDRYPIYSSDASGLTIGIYGYLHTSPND